MFQQLTENINLAIEQMGPADRLSIVLMADKAEIVAESRHWLRYDLPPRLVGKVWKGRYRGQEQRWFALRFLGEDSDIDLATAHPEFDAWRWVELDDVPALVIPFKRDTYRAVVEEFKSLLGRA